MQLNRTLVVVVNLLSVNCLPNMKAPFLTLIAFTERWSRCPLYSYDVVLFMIQKVKVSRQLRLRHDILQTLPNPMFDRQKCTCYDSKRIPPPQGYRHHRPHPTTTSTLQSRHRSSIHSPTTIKQSKSRAVQVIATTDVNWER